MSERLSPTKREQPEGNEGPPCSDLLGFSFGSRLPSRPPASLELVTASPASQPHTRWTGLGRASGALLLLSAPPSPRVSRAAETPRLTSLPPPGRSLRGERGAARSYLRRGTPPPPASSGLGRGLLHAGESPFAGGKLGHGRQTEKRARKGSEKERRRGNTAAEALPAPRFARDPLSHALAVLPSPTDTSGVRQVVGVSASLVHSRPYPVPWGSKAGSPPPACSGPGWGSRSRSTASCEWKETGCVCVGGVVFTAPSTEPKFTPCQALAESGALHRCCRIISPCPAHRRQGCSWAEAVLGAEHPPPCRWW